MEYFNLVTLMKQFIIIIINLFILDVIDLIFDNILHVDKNNYSLLFFKAILRLIVVISVLINVYFISSNLFQGFKELWNSIWKK